MFKHEKQLFHPVAVERPNPQYAVLMQEQLGGGGKRRTESGDAVYVAEFPHQRSGDQGFISRYRSRGIRPYGNGGADDQSAQRSRCGCIRRRERGEIQSHVILGLNPGLINSSGYSWTGDYVTVTGDLCADLLSNIASEQRAKVVYEYLYRQIEDKKSRETIDFLLNREEAHNAMFREAFNKVQDTGSNRDFDFDSGGENVFQYVQPVACGFRISSDSRDSAIISVKCGVRSLSDRIVCVERTGRDFIADEAVRRSGGGIEKTDLIKKSRYRLFCLAPDFFVFFICLLMKHTTAVS